MWKKVKTALDHARWIGWAVMVLILLPFVERADETMRDGDINNDG